MATNHIPSEARQQAGIFRQMQQTEHEQLVFCHDPDLGLQAIIAIHNTNLGPALGGTRYWTYSSEQEALEDVLRLSRGMTWKAAISGLNLGGGKAVVMKAGEPSDEASYWRRYGQFIESLNGKYITAEDVGTSLSIIEHIARETRHVTGKPPELGGGGDPSPVTAYGTYMGMKACAGKAFGRETLAGKKIAVQGIGSVGSELVRLLSQEGAEICICDINEVKVRKMAEKYRCKVVSEQELYDLDIDIYAPCALGATLNDDTIARLRCAVVAGAANNQLADENRHADMLKERGILYAPDFLINAGGLIHCYSELEGYERDKAMKKAAYIHHRTLEIIETAEKLGTNTHEAALRIARQRVNEAPPASFSSTKPQFS